MFDVLPLYWFSSFGYYAIFIVLLTLQALISLCSWKLLEGMMRRRCSRVSLMSLKVSFLKIMSLFIFIVKLTMLTWSNVADSVASENSIPLSPQWLYAKPSETKVVILWNVCNYIYSPFCCWKCSFDKCLFPDCMYPF